MLLGALVMASAVIGLFFLRFWRDTRDRLFLMFSLAFWVLAANWLGLGLLVREEEARTLLYVVRLVAYMLILVAIVDKNRTRIRPRVPTLGERRKRAV
jgi:hypothetical protein